MTIERRMFCDYESCKNSVPDVNVMPEGWVYVNMKRVPFGNPRECHFCSISHASIAEWAIANDEEALRGESANV